MILVVPTKTCSLFSTVNKLFKTFWFILFSVTSFTPLSLFLITSCSTSYNPLLFYVSAFDLVESSYIVDIFTLENGSWSICQVILDCSNLCVVNSSLYMWVFMYFIYLWMGAIGLHSSTLYGDSPKSFLSGHITNPCLQTSEGNWWSSKLVNTICCGSFLLF